MNFNLFYRFFSLCFTHTYILAQNFKTKVFTAQKILILECLALQCTTMHYNALQCTAMYCNAPQWTAMHGNALQCTAMHNNARQCKAMHCNTLQCTAMPSNALLYIAMHWQALHCTVLYCFSLQCTTMHCTALICTAIAEHYTEFTQKYGAQTFRVCCQTDLSTLDQDGGKLFSVLLYQIGLILTQCMSNRGLFGLPVHLIVRSDFVWNSFGLCSRSSSSSSSSSSGSSNISCSNISSRSSSSHSSSCHLASAWSGLQCIYNNGWRAGLIQLDPRLIRHAAGA